MTWPGRGIAAVIFQRLLQAMHWKKRMSWTVAWPLCRVLVEPQAGQQITVMVLVVRPGCQVSVGLGVQLEPFWSTHPIRD